MDVFFTKNSDIIVEKTRILVVTVFTMNRLFEYNRYSAIYYIQNGKEKYEFYDLRGFICSGFQQIICSQVK